MVDSFDLFRRLSCGAKYDKQKFSKDLTTFDVSSLTQLNATYSELKQSDHLVFQGSAGGEQGKEKSVAAALDFFGDGVTAEPEERDKSGRREGRGDGGKGRLGKRKRKGRKFFVADNSCISLRI